MYRKLAIGSLLTAMLLVAGCDVRGECESLSNCDESKWDKTNFRTIKLWALNYTTTDIFDGYLLPLEKNDIAYGERISVGPGTLHDAKEWSLSGDTRFFWNTRWILPKKFKVWWRPIYDRKEYDKNFSSYDKYKNKMAASGSVWCEHEIEINNPVINDREAKLVLHFYPDGRVQGNIEYENAFSEDITRRDEFPILKNGHCIKEIQNPYYGKKKPISIN